MVARWNGLRRLERRVRARRLLLVSWAAAFGVMLLASRASRDGDRAIAPAEAELPSCSLGAACPDPGPDGWAARIEVLLETRAPEMSEPVRRRVARVVVEESRAAGLDPLLAAAIIDVESGFDSGARSWAGARGLMQLRPETMAREAARYGMAAGDPHDPVANVRLGIRYFRRLIGTFEREDRALMAYNAGPNRIASLMQRGRIPDRFRGYPARVFAEQRRLRRSLGVEPAPAAAAAAVAVAVASAQPVLDAR
jgi:soluble lytic murein transglycosylase-like protein